MFLKKLKILVIIFLSLSIFATTFGAEKYSGSSYNYGNVKYGTGKYIKVNVSEVIPGMDCIVSPSFKDRRMASCQCPAIITSVEDCKCPDYLDLSGVTYTCYLEKGFKSISFVFGVLMKYISYLLGIIAVLFVVYHAVLVAMSGVNPGAKEKAKTNLIKLLLGILLLFLGGFLLYLLAPFVFYSGR